MEELVDEELGNEVDKEVYNEPIPIIKLSDEEFAELISDMTQKEIREIFEDHTEEEQQILVSKLPKREVVEEETENEQEEEKVSIWQRIKSKIIKR